jgi:hypothetical protein
LRLKTLKTKLPLQTRLMLGAMRLAMRGREPGIPITMKYRPEFFGRASAAVTQRALRGQSEWSPGERELFAAFVSRQNQCPY